MGCFYEGCVIQVAGAEIVVPSCDDHSANIGVFETKWRGRNAYHYVSLPDFTRDYKPIYPFDLRPEEFDRILTENRQAVLAVSAQLNDDSERPQKHHGAGQRLSAKGETL